jgi:hypothetical protein
MFDAMGPRVQPATHPGMYQTGAVALPSIPNLLPASWGHTGSTDASGTSSPILMPGTVPGLLAIAGITVLLAVRNPEHALPIATVGAAGFALVLGKNYATVTKAAAP